METSEKTGTKPIDKNAKIRVWNYFMRVELLIILPLLFSINSTVANDELGSYFELGGIGSHNSGGFARSNWGVSAQVLGAGLSLPYFWVDARVGGWKICRLFEKQTRFEKWLGTWYVDSSDMIVETFFPLQLRFTPLAFFSYPGNLTSYYWSICALSIGLDYCPWAKRSGGSKIFDEGQAVDLHIAYRCGQEVFSELKIGYLRLLSPATDIKLKKERPDILGADELYYPPHRAERFYIELVVSMGYWKLHRPSWVENNKLTLAPVLQPARIIQMTMKEIETKRIRRAKEKIAEYKALRNVKGLVDAFGYKDSSLRRAAVEALGVIKDTTALHSLLTVLKDDTDSGVRKSAQDALINLGCNIENIIERLFREYNSTDTANVYYKILLYADKPELKELYDAAKERYENFIFEKNLEQAVIANSIDAYLECFKKYPKYKFAIRVKNALPINFQETFEKALFEWAESTDTEGSYNLFLNLYPNSQFSSQISNSLNIVKRAKLNNLLIQILEVRYATFTDVPTGILIFSNKGTTYESERRYASPGYRFMALRLKIEGSEYMSLRRSEFQVVTEGHVPITPTYGFKLMGEDGYLIEGSGTEESYGVPGYLFLVWEVPEKTTKYLKIGDQIISIPYR